MKSILAVSSLLVLVASVAYAQNAATAKQYVDCSCSPSKRGFSNGARDQLRDMLMKMREYEAELKFQAKTDKTLTPAEIQKRINARSAEKWQACTNNFSHEQCVNADVAFRQPAGRVSTSFCRYDATWSNVAAGKRTAACDKNPATAARDQTITEGTPEIVSVTPPPTVKPAAPAAPAPAPAPPKPAAPAPAPAAPAAPAPAAPAKPATPASPAQPATPATPQKPATTAVPPGRPNVPAAAQTPPPGTAPATQPATDDTPASEPNAAADPNAATDGGSVETEGANDFPPVTNGATPEPEVRNERVCFPATATVQLEDGSVKAMRELELGDKVLVGGNNIYSPVYMFTHKMETVRHVFVSLKTAGGLELALTRSHYLYVNGKLSPAGSAKVGDLIESASGDAQRIVSITQKVMDGLYNPQTVHGDIVVDGVRASTYTTVAAPDAAHAMLAPLRSLYTRFGGFTTAMLDQGSDKLAGAVSTVVA